MIPATSAGIFLYYDAPSSSLRALAKQSLYRLPRRQVLLAMTFFIKRDLT